MNIYLELTRAFNTNKVRTIISSGQAAVLHHIAIMSKDGDWIIREDEESLRHVLSILESYGAKYRFGAPLDIRWLSNGWSSHFEFMHQGMRVRTDFVSRPPRLSAKDLESLWFESVKQEIPYIGLIPLAELKKTNREKDYAVIGELSRLMSDIRNQLRYSRSARDIIDIEQKHPDVVDEISKERPLLRQAARGRDILEQELDAERRRLMRANEQRLQAYIDASSRWSSRWKILSKTLADLPLFDAHERVVKEAESLLPVSVERKPDA
ncbi:MAG: hypothetical protein GF350_13380 [Chitinivibrionales bacterium]|nr:hypothetical protein [Chitinivibrionales bacterium]